MQENEDPFLTLAPWLILFCYVIVVLQTCLYVKHAQFCVSDPGRQWYHWCQQQTLLQLQLCKVQCSSLWRNPLWFFLFNNYTFSSPNPSLLSQALAFNFKLYFPVVLRQWIDIILLFSLQMLRPHTLSSANTLYYATSRQILTSHHIHIAVAVGTCLLKNTFIGWNCLFPKKNLVLQYNLLYLLKFCLFSKIFATL